MDILQRFLTYAADFEQTLVDDDWARLAPHFADDAVYEVDGGDRHWRMEGRAAIFAGLRKSLQGFDRRFSGRDVVPTGAPEVEGDQLRIGWSVTYRRDDAPPFTLRGRSTLRVRDGLIVYLADAFAPGTAAEMAAWQQQTGIALDPSYT